MADIARAAQGLGEKSSVMKSDTNPAMNSDTNSTISPDTNPAMNSATNPAAASPPKVSIAAVRQEFDGLEAGTETGQSRAVAGRLMLRRVQGKVAFGTIQDSTGRLQIFAPAARTFEFEKFCECSIGDWLEVSGEIMTTRRGELSVRADHWQVLARTENPFPDKWHGLADVDTRYRQRYLDLWVTEQARETFVLRSRLLSETRSWLEAQGYLEVETPILHPIAGGALAKPFVTHHEALDKDLYLRVAPELYLKRLVIGGMEKVYEIGRVFRNEGLSTRHNPEFTLLELYCAYGNYETMMDLTKELIVHLAQSLLGTLRLAYGDRELSLEEPSGVRVSGDAGPANSSASERASVSAPTSTPAPALASAPAGTPWRRVTMTQLLHEKLGVELGLDTPLEYLRSLCRQHEVLVEEWWGAGKLLCELYEKTCEPKIWEPTFVVNYPLEVSPLAMECPEQPGWTERFELIIAGREVANAFSELTDPQQQRERFEAQASYRQQGDLEAMPIDEDYLKAMSYGMPPTGGLGIGIDRLAGLLAKQHAIRDVLLFPTLR